MKKFLCLMIAAVLLLPMLGCAREEEEMPPKGILYLGGGPILQEFSVSGGPEFGQGREDIVISVPAGLVQEGLTAAIYGRTSQGDQVELLNGQPLSPGRPYSISQSVYRSYESMYLQLAYEWPGWGTLSRRMINLYTHEDMLSVFPGEEEKNRENLGSGRESRMLPITFTEDPQGETVIAVEEPHFREIRCLGVKDVSITLQGKDMPLEEALLSRKLTVSDLAARAQVDAQLGICQEVIQSQEGLTTFSYEYPEFTFRYVFDVREDKDGQTLVAEAAILGKAAEH